MKLRESVKELVVAPKRAEIIAYAAVGLALIALAVALTRSGCCHAH